MLPKNKNSYSKIQGKNEGSKIWNIKNIVCCYKITFNRFLKDYIFFLKQQLKEN